MAKYAREVLPVFLFTADAIASLCSAMAIPGRNSTLVSAHRLSRPDPLAALSRVRAKGLRARGLSPNPASFPEHTKSFRGASKILLTSRMVSRGL
jgi:hypothetical protein